MAQLANPSTIDLTSLVNLFTSKSTGGSQSSTTSSNISKEGMDRLVQQILESDQGIASILSGPKKAGIYNSSTTQQLLGDFVARTTGELAARQAGTTTTQTSRNTADPTLNPARTVGGMALTSLLSPVVSRGLESVGVTGGIGGLGRSLADLIFGDPGPVEGYDRDTGDTAVDLRALDNAMMAEDFMFDYQSSEPYISDTGPADNYDYSWLYDDTGDIWGD